MKEKHLKYVSHAWMSFTPLYAHWKLQNTAERKWKALAIPLLGTYPIVTKIFVYKGSDIKVHSSIVHNSWKVQKNFHE